MSFSATDAAFEGFRVVRRNPVALVAWTVVYLVVMPWPTLFAIGRDDEVHGRLTDLTRQMEAL